MGRRVSGLDDAQAAHARRVIIKDAKNMITHKREIHYSQGPDRWEGIDGRRTHLNNTYPKHCDCSSTSTWMLWDAMGRPYGVRDVVNGANWRAGYTGTQYDHGKRVKHDSNLKIGDLIFYGDQGGGIPEHVAVYVGGGFVFSHGSEGGPYILRLDYRHDRRQSRRYI
jgi:cell wall-associated NlpC family hydrolase